MASIDQKVQEFVHALEVGKFSKWLKFAVILAVVAGIASWLLLQRFRGLPTREGMEISVAAREIARGNGYSTKVIRPLAMWQIAKNRGKESLATSHFPETLHAPLYPAVLSGVFAAVVRDWSFPNKPGMFVWRPDLIVALTGILLFVAGIGVSYLTAARLFDKRLAATVAGLCLASFGFWSYSMSGLPQPLMLLLFSTAIYGMVRAVQAKLDGAGLGLWIALTGICFGLLALAQPLTSFIFLGALTFCVIYFRPRLLVAAILVGAFAVFVLPWMYWLYRVSGSPLGIAGYSLFNGINGSELLHLRQNGMDLQGLSLFWFRPKMQSGLEAQFSRLYQLLGYVIAAPIFFVALLHPFKRPEIAAFRWAVLAMWMFAIAGIALFGPFEDIASGQLHLLFVPIMSCYGMAVIFTMIARFTSYVVWIRVAVVTLIYAITALPLIFELLPQQRAAVYWPPYWPPVTARLAELFTPDEIIASDQAWATAWYGDRKSLLLPEKVVEFTNISDFRQLGRDVSGLLMTPTSGGEKFYGGIVQGDYKEWAGFILRQPNLNLFPLQEFVPIGNDAAICLWADRKRWNREQQQ